MNKLLLPKNLTICVHISVNNIIVSLSNEKGETLKQFSGGSIGLKGTKKSGTYSAETLGENTSSLLSFSGVNTVRIIFKGRGPGREQFLFGFLKNNINLHSLEDKKLISFNGCRPPKKRRI